MEIDTFQKLEEKEHFLRNIFSFSPWVPFQKGFQTNIIYLPSSNFDPQLPDILYTIFFQKQSC